MKNHKIVWKNIYHMLIYAIKELEHFKPDDIDVENFEGIDDLLTAMMHKALDILNENNYLNEYNKVTVSSDKPKGRILIEDSYRTGAIAKGQLVHTKFEFNVDSLQNRIIKSAIATLIKSGTLGKYYLTINTKAYEGMHEIGDIKLIDVDFDSLDMDYIPMWYKPALAVSRLIQKNLLGLDKSGSLRLFNLDNTKRLEYIFEEFIRNFYIKEYKTVKTTNPQYTYKGDLNKLDMLLENEYAAIVIDAKWYNSINVQTNRKANSRAVMHYMLLYLKNKEITKGLTREELENTKLDGVVLYGRTDLNCDILNKEIPAPLRHELTYKIKEHTIDLNTDFEKIKMALVSLADVYFNKQEE